MKYANSSDLVSFTLILYINTCEYILGLTIEMLGEYYHLSYGGIRMKWNNGSAWFLSVDLVSKPPDGTPIHGLCGDLNGEPWGMENT